jgi:protein-S-isoprenylcysteine O-methyltransferase Ste14
MPHSISAIAKTVLFTAFVPGTVAGIVPWWLRDGSAVASRGIQACMAIALIAVGVAIYLYTAFWGFAWIGGGTPAPVAPTKTLVVRGLHHYVRNPMYIGIGLIVAGQAWLFRSPVLARYLAFFALAVHLFVLFYEEPTLRKQFGEEYERYRASVPRWIPKIGR